MTRFIRNLLAVAFVAVAVFAMAGPASAAVQPPPRFTGWSTHPIRTGAPAVMLPKAHRFFYPGTCFSGWSTHPFRSC